MGFFHKDEPEPAVVPVAQPAVVPVTEPVPFSNPEIGDQEALKVSLLGGVTAAVDAAVKLLTIFEEVDFFVPVADRPIIHDAVVALGDVETLLASL